MAIAPIDLQTLFTQMDKAGKTHLPQREGQPLQQMMQTIQSQKKDEEMMNQINEAKDTGEGSEKVNNNRQKGQEDSSGKGGKRESNEEKEEEKKVSVLSDPALGKNIDISL